MQFNFNRRTIVIGGIVIGIMLILSGALFALGKTGTIDLRSFADTVVTKTQQLTGTKAIGTTVEFAITSPCFPTPSGTQIIIVNGSTGQKYSTTYAVPDYRIIQITGVVPGNYTSDSSGNVYVSPFEVVQGQSTTSATGNVMNCDTSGGIGTTCGGATCSATQHCNVNNACVNNCSALSCPTGQTCNSTTKECQTTIQTPHEITLSISVETDCTEAACTNRDSYGKVNGIPVAFGTYSGITNNALAQGYNLEFQRVMTGNYTFNINDPTKAGYNSAYESKTVTQNVYVPTASTFIEFKLAKKPVLAQAATFDFIGIAKDSSGNAVQNAFINLNPVSCVDSGSYSCPYNKNTRSGTAPADNHSITTPLNYSITGLYNIAQPTPKFPSYTGTIGLTGYTGSNFTISATDIKVDSSGKSFFYKELLINPTPPTPTTLPIYGTVKDTSGALKAGVKIAVSASKTGTSYQSEASTVNSMSGQNGINEEYNYIIQDVPKPTSTTSFYYTLTGIPAGYILDEDNNGMADEYVRGSIAPGDDLKVRNFLLKRIVDIPVTVSGKVYDKASSKPLPNAIITIFKLSDGSEVKTSCITTDSQGKYTASFKVPSTVTYKFIALKSDYLKNDSAKKNLSISSGQKYTLDFYLNKCAVNSETGLCSTATDLGIAKCTGPSSTNCTCNCNIKTTKINVFGKEVIVNPKIKPYLEAIKLEVQNGMDTGSIPRYNFWNNGCDAKDGGGFNCRYKSGTTRCSVSNHAFGTAIDFNPSCNPQYKPKAGNCRTDIPKSIRDVFKKYGFRWGGDYKKSCDAMHFEYMGK